MASKSKLSERNALKIGEVVKREMAKRCVRAEGKCIKFIKDIYIPLCDFKIDCTCSFDICASHRANRR